MRNQIIIQIALDLLDKWEKYECKEIKQNVIRCNKGKLQFVKHNDGNSWCASFVSTIIAIYNDNYSDKINIKLTASTSQMYASAKANNYLIDKKPQEGDIFYKKYSSSYCKKLGNSSICGHVGIVYKVDYAKNSIITIEGNANNKIAIVKHNLIDLIEGNSNYPEGVYFIHLNNENSNSKGNQNYNYINVKHNYYL